MHNYSAIWIAVMILYPANTFTIPVMINFLIVLYTRQLDWECGKKKELAKNLTLSRFLSNITLKKKWEVKFLHLRRFWDGRLTFLLTNLYDKSDVSFRCQNFKQI